MKSEAKKLKKTCQICTDEKSSFVLNNKRVCMKCDELLFDIEIEAEDDEKDETALPLPKAA